MRYRGCKERPQLRRLILKFCQDNNITLQEMYDTYSCMGNLKKQLQKMIYEKKGVEYE